MLGIGQLDVHHLESNRKKIADYARIEGLPAFEVEMNHSWVPVVLLNKRTIAHWDWVLAETIGIAQSLHANNPSDHGYARLPGYANPAEPFQAPSILYSKGTPSGALMDLFSPAQAGPNAAAGTGYKFLSMTGYFAGRDRGSREFVDLAYAVSHEDRIRFWLYHAVKRAGVVRIQYAFDEHHNGWIVSQRRTLQQDPGFRDDGFEQCNNSRCGELAQLHVDEMRGRLSRLLNVDANFVYHTVEGRSFLDQAKHDLLQRDWRERNSYDPDYLNRPGYLHPMERFFKPGLSHEQKVDALCYLLAVNVFEEVLQVKNHLGVREARANQYENPNISAIFIYSDYPENLERFYGADITLGSATLEGGNNGFSSNYFKVRRIFEHFPYDSVRNGYRP
jgi:hypothetical protein